MKVTIHNIICYAAIIVLAYFLFSKSKVEQSGETVIKQRDSISAYYRLFHANEAIKYTNLADSCSSVIKQLEIKDSINKYKWQNERIKLKNYNVYRTNFILDSIAQSNNIRHVDLLNSRRNFILSR